MMCQRVGCGRIATHTLTIEAYSVGLPHTEKNKHKIEFHIVSCLEHSREATIENLFKTGVTWEFIDACTESQNLPFIDRTTAKVVPVPLERRRNETVH